MYDYLASAFTASGEKPELVKTLPTWRVRLDPSQYQQDMERLRAEQNRGNVLRAKATRAKREGRPTEEIETLERQAIEAEQVTPVDLHDTFNVLVRRKPKENNFKAVLETIRYDPLLTICVRRTTI